MARDLMKERDGRTGLGFGGIVLASLGGLVDGLTAFGLFAVSAMLVTYALEARSPWFTLAFAASCALGSAYGFLQGAWPFGLVEGVWAIVAAVKWRRRVAL
jgi:hypothetical protein